MLRIPWLLTVNVFINVFDTVLSFGFPSFFDDADLRELGIRGHKSSYTPAPVTGRYLDGPTGYVPPPEGEQYRQKIPPNGLPIHQLPQTLQNRSPMKIFGRGDPTNQNIVQQLAEADAYSPFPNSDGKSYGGDDTFNLNELPKRLSETNKWDEFRALIAEEGEKQNGQIMSNWEDDAHRWAAYSKHLLERGAHETQKQAARMRPRQLSPVPYAPSLGHEAYWAEQEPPKPVQRQSQSYFSGPIQPQSQSYFPSGSPWNENGQLISWKRRQMEEPVMFPQQNQDEYSDNIQGPLEQKQQMPPIYYKNQNTPKWEYELSPQELERLRQVDDDDGLRTGNLARYLPPYPQHHSSSGPEMVPTGEYGPDLLTKFEKSSSNIPGPGSEKDFPNGYLPYGPQSPMSSGMGPEQGGRYPRNPEMNPRGPRGGGPNNFERVPMPRQHPEAKPGDGDYAGPEDYLESYNSMLRTGKIPNHLQGGPKPGSEGDYGDGFHSSMGGGNMGLPSGQMGVGPLPGGRYPQNFGKPGPHRRPKALRNGGGYPSMDYPGPGMGPENYPESNSSPLRMGMPAPGPGSEGDFPEGFNPNMAGANMGLPLEKELGPLPGRVHKGPPRGIQNHPKPIDMDESDLVKGRGMPDGSSPIGFPPKGMPGLGGMRGPNGMPRGPPGQMSPAIKFPGREPGESLEDYIGPDAPRPPPNFGRDNPNRMGQRGRPPPRDTRIPTGYELMTIAKKKIAASNRIDNLTGDGDPDLAQRTGTTTPRPLTKEELINRLPQFDDFHAPIRWVTFNSPDTRDGLARVTDKKSHQNQQYVIEGELYLPIIDESMSRLGWTTEDPLAFSTDAPIVIPPNDSSLKVVLRSMDLNKTDEREWLAYETILGARMLHETECDGQSCQARCHKTGCDAACKGDTCATGCVGISCNAVCKGPGCFSMCIGDQCTAKCEGLNCETRCWGRSCESECHSFSCQYSVNGIENKSNTTWDTMYPQYDMKGNPDVYGKQGQQTRPGPGRSGDRPHSNFGDEDDYVD